MADIMHVTIREGKLILKMKHDISFYKRKVNKLNQKIKRGQNNE